VWTNFNSMPVLLKFLTAWAAFCFLLLAMSLIPSNSFAIQGHSVTFQQWWSSGAGPLASLTGIFGPVVAWALATKWQYARVSCVAFLTFVFVAAPLAFGVSVYALPGLVVVGLAWYYLYRWRTVKAYFSP
jgi:hypothetical protein